MFTPAKALKNNTNTSTATATPFFNRARRGMPLSRCIQRKCAGCGQEEKEQAQRKETTGSDAGGKAAPSIVSNVLSSAGRPLDGGARQFMENRFGQDFGQVRIHVGDQAAESATAIQARAYTSGKDIVFGEGEYQPGSERGKRLLAHELAHVGQQAGKGDALPVQRTTNDSGRCSVSRRGVAPSISNCSIYARNSWWLPMAYVNNATCACLSTPDSTTANCVRGFLQNRLRAAPAWLKRFSLSNKINDNPLSPQYAAYQSFVQTFLTPVIYRDHVDAYANCCCPSGPAPYPAWIGVTSAPIQPCSAVGFFIRQFGSCHGTPGSW